MTSARNRCLVLSILPAGSVAQAAQGGDGRSLFADRQFRRGFLLSYPDSSKGRSVEAVLHLGDANHVPAWRLCQWATNHSLATSMAKDAGKNDATGKFIYAVANMNLGWEIPGAFDAAVQIRDLALSAIAGNQRDRAAQ